MRDRSIADLHASLSWDLDDFERGTGKIDASFKALLGRAQALGARFRTLGRDMTLGLTVPIAGIVGAVAAMSKSTADDLKAIGNAAQVAGEDLERFQRQAHAAKSVGVEVDKLGDIFKDTREKIGDFVATGGGELDDFFKNVAPKVGVTKEMFAGLSGKDALQLYYNSLVQANVSQEEMVFYLESIADEATALIPLLAANGREFRKLGEEAIVYTPEQLESLEKYRKALEKIGYALDRIVVAAVDSGLIDMLTSLADRVANWITRLAETNPAIIRFVGGVAIAIAALGPLVTVLTMIAVVVLPLFLARLGPVFFLLSALINPIGTAVVFLAKLSGGFSALVGGIGGALGVLGRMLLLLTRLHPITAAITTVFVLFGDEIVQALSVVWQMAREALGESFQRLVRNAAELISELKARFDEFAQSPLGQFIAEIVRLLGVLVGALTLISGTVVVAAIDLLISLLAAILQYVTDLVRIVNLLLRADWSKAWDAAGQAVRTTIDNMLPSFKRLFGWIDTALSRLGLLQQGVAAGTDVSNASFGASISAPTEKVADGNSVWGWNLPDGLEPYTLPEKPNGGRGGGGGGRSGPSEEELQARREELELQHQLDLAREAGDEERIRQLERQIELGRRIEDYERAGLANADAKIKAEQELAELDRVKREALTESLVDEQLALQLQEARLRGDEEAIRYLEREKFLEDEIADLVARGLDAQQAEIIASERLLRLEEARADAIAKRVREEEEARQIELARLRGDDPAQIRALEERQRNGRRIEELMREQDLSRAEAEEQAMREASDRAQAYLQGNFRDAFRGGLRAALDGNLKDFFKRWMEDASFNALAKVLDRLADRMADLFFGNQSKSGGGLFDVLGKVLGLATGGGGSSGALGQKMGGLKAKMSSLPGFANEGSFRINGLSGVDRNILSLNGTPVAKVSQGEIMDIRKGAPAAQQGTLIVRMQRDGGLTGYLRGIAGEVVSERAPAIGAATQQSTLARFAAMQDDRFE